MAVVKVYEDIDMRLCIPGLMKYLETHKAKAHDNSDMFMFINKKKSSLKVVWEGRYLLQVKKPTSEGKITLEELRIIPSYFGRGFLNLKTEKRIGEILGRLKLKAAS